MRIRQVRNAGDLYGIDIYVSEAGSISKHQIPDSEFFCGQARVDGSPPHTERICNLRTLHRYLLKRRACEPEASLHVQAVQTEVALEFRSISYDISGNAPLSQLHALKFAVSHDEIFANLNRIHIEQAG